MSTDISIIDNENNVVIDRHEIDGLARKVKEMTSATLDSTRAMNVLSSNLNLLSNTHERYRSIRDETLEKMEQLAQEIKS